MTSQPKEEVLVDGLGEPLTLPDSLAESRAPLPLPVRGTRYAVGAILIAVILTVVTATYRRIEQQLQLTLESRLTSVLNENTHAITGWLQSRERLTQRIAQLDLVQKMASALSKTASSKKQSRKTAVESFSNLIRTGMADEIYLLDPEGNLAWKRGNTHGVSLPSSRLKEVLHSGSLVYLEHSKEEARILSLSLVGPGTQPLAVIVLSIEAEAMTRDLRGSEHRESGESYAFDQKGTLSLHHGGNGSKVEKRGFLVPPGAAQAENLQTISTTAPPIEEYIGHRGTKVVSAWTWLPVYGLGVATEIPYDEAYSSVTILRQSFLILVTLVGAAVLGFIALGRWTLRIREESVLMTRRLGRLARAIQPLSAALEYDPSAVVLVDAGGTVVYANASSQRVLDIDTPLLGLAADAIFNKLHPELKAALISGKDSIVAQGPEFDDETLLVSSRSLKIGRAPHYLYMLRPITQQVRRQEVEHWKKLIRVLSHELNNALAPITSLLSSARTVNQKSHQDPRLGAIFESIAERTAHLVSFLEGYREVARLPNPDPREIDWELFLKGLESQMTFHRLGAPPSSPGYFDPIQLERVMVNLLKNAVEAGSSPDEIEVEIVQNEDLARINVLDRGSGMPKAVLKQAMLPFFSTKRTGTGVGLALSREIIESHGGQLTLANRDGGGLIVSCFLPLEAPPPPSRVSLGDTKEKSLT